MTTATPTANPDEHTLVHGLVPMVHVMDVEISIRFYERLGLTCDQRIATHGRTTWAALSVRQAMLMLTQASGPIDAGQQAVLFYLYCDDVRGLRRRLLEQGIVDAGQFFGAPLESTPGGGRGVVFDVASPFYMPAGEVRVHDPDGYCLLVGQRT